MQGCDLLTWPDILGPGPRLGGNRRVFCQRRDGPRKKCRSGIGRHGHGCPAGRSDLVCRGAIRHKARGAGASRLMRTLPFRERSAGLIMPRCGRSRRCRRMAPCVRHERLIRRTSFAGPPARQDWPVGDTMNPDLTGLEMAFLGNGDVQLEISANLGRDGICPMCRRPGKSEFLAQYCDPLSTEGDAAKAPDAVPPGASGVSYWKSESRDCGA